MKRKFKRMAGIVLAGLMISASMTVMAAEIPNLSEQNNQTETIVTETENFQNEITSNPGNIAKSTHEVQESIVENDNETADTDKREETNIYESVNEDDNERIVNDNATNSILEETNDNGESTNNQVTVVTRFSYISKINGVDVEGTQLTSKSFEPGTVLEITAQLQEYEDGYNIVSSWYCEGVFEDTSDDKTVIITVPERDQAEDGYAEGKYVVIQPNIQYVEKDTGKIPVTITLGSFVQLVEIDGETVNIGDGAQYTVYDGQKLKFNVDLKQIEKLNLSFNGWEINSDFGEDIFPIENPMAETITINLNAKNIDSFVNVLVNVSDKSTECTLNVVNGKIISVGDNGSIISDTECKGYVGTKVDIQAVAPSSNDCTYVFKRWIGEATKFMTDPTKENTTLCMNYKTSENISAIAEYEIYQNDINVSEVILKNGIITSVNGVLTNKYNYQNEDGTMMAAGFFSPGTVLGIRANDNDFENGAWTQSRRFELENDIVSNNLGKNSLIGSSFVSDRDMSTTYRVSSASDVILEYKDLLNNNEGGLTYIHIQNGVFIAKGNVIFEYPVITEQRLYAGTDTVTVRAHEPDKSAPNGYRYVFDHWELSSGNSGVIENPEKEETRIRIKRVISSDWLGISAIYRLERVEDTVVIENEQGASLIIEVADDDDYYYYTGFQLVTEAMKDDAGQEAAQAVIDQLGGNAEATAYDIYLKDLMGNEASVQEGDTVTVILPVPAGWTAVDVVVYHVADDGTLTDMDAVPSGEKSVSFETSHFSTYVLARETEPEETETEPTVPGEGETEPTVPGESETEPTVPGESETDTIAPNESGTETESDTAAPAQTSDTHNGQIDSVKTGDETPIVLLICLALVALGVIITAGTKIVFGKKK